LLDISLFAFATPGLEDLFRKHVAKTRTLWTPVCAANMLVGLVLFICKYWAAKRPLDELHGVCMVAVAMCVLMGTLLGIIIFKPAFYLKHWRAIKVGLFCCIIASYRIGLITVLWMKSEAGKVHVHSWLQQLHAFAVENMYASSMWILVLSFPIGQVPDLLFCSIALVVAMANNRSICMSPHWGQNLLTLSPGYLAAAQGVSLFVSDMGGPFLLGHAAPPIVSCPAVLGIWQLLGWLAACLLVFVADILRRRAFLRTREAQAYLGPEYGANALKWPFMRSGQLQRCLKGLLVLFYTCSLIWCTALPMLA
jgi:hypothetical protein